VANKIYHIDEHCHFEPMDLLLVRDDTTIKLDAIHAKLLTHFLQHSNTVITRETLFEQIWGNGYFSDNAINRGISVLRKHLGEQRKDYISTLPKIGYRFNLPDNAPETTGNSKDVVQHCQTITEPSDDQPFVVEPPNTAVKAAKLQFNMGWFLLITITVIIVFLGINYLKPSKIITTGNQNSNNPVKKLNIAILPFVDMSADANQQSFVNGLNAEILNQLTLIPTLVVIGPNFELKRQTQYVLKGSVRISGHTVRTTVQLMDVNSDEYLFATTFVQSSKDLFSVQTLISQQIRAAIKLLLIYPPHNHANALAKLAPLVVEQLVIAKGQIDKRN
jgi:TolB-like protein/DNA-binding winged helix-turn-helix (wHTH) protein